MATYSISMSAGATAIPTSSSSSSSASLSNLSFDYLSLTTIINFSIKAKQPIRPPRLIRTTHFLNSSSPLSRSRVFTSPAAFDGGAPPEAEEEIEETVEEKEEEEESGGLEDEGVGSLAEEERRLFVGNLPFSITSSQLADVFNEAGRVTSVQMIYDKVTKRSRGFAFVTMGSVEEANEAIRKFEGSQVGGRTIKVNFPEVPKGGEREVMGPKIKSSYQGFRDSSHKIYAGNLSWSLTSQGLREAFASQPGLLSAKVIYDRGSGRSKGYGFVTFASEGEVESALGAMNGVEVEGRPLRLNFAEGRAHTPSPPPEEDSISRDDELEGNQTLVENVEETSDMLSSASV